MKRRLYRYLVRRSSFVADTGMCELWNDLIRACGKISAPLAERCVSALIRGLEQYASRTLAAWRSAALVNRISVAPF